jgi:hypothetical protein
LILFSYKRSTQRRVNSLLRRCSDVARDLELLVENPEEGFNEINVVLSRVLTLKPISLSFSRMEEGLDIIVVYNYMHL